MQCPLKPKRTTNTSSLLPTCHWPKQIIWANQNQGAEKFTPLSQWGHGKCVTAEESEELRPIIMYVYVYLVYTYNTPYYIYGNKLYNLFCIPISKESQD